MIVAERMTRDPLCIGPDDGIEQALAAMDRLGVRHLPVVERGRLAGVLSDRELLAATGWIHGERQRLRPEAPARQDPRRVRTLLGALVHTVAPGATLADAARALAARHSDCLPVVEDERLVGILTVHDVLLALHEARAEERDPARNPPASARMTRAPVTLPESATLREAHACLAQAGVRHLPLVRGQDLAGILSDKDLLFAAGRGIPPDAPVTQIVAGRTITIPPNTPLAQAARLLAEHRIGCLPVVAGAKLLGILTSHDVLLHCAQELG